ncbi:MAG: Ig-like domain-containing protein [Candidatus Eremiobacterota bacterium]
MTATGTFTNGSTQDLSSQVTWSSFSPGVATVDAAGRATGVTPGSATVQASLGTASGSTDLTVTKRLSRVSPSPRRRRSFWWG